MTTDQIYALMQNNNYTQAGQGLLNNLMTAAQPGEQRDMAVMNTNLMRRGVDNSGIGTAALRDLLVNRDANRQGMVLQSMNALQPWAQQQFTQSNMNYEAQLQKWLRDTAPKEKKGSSIGAILGGIGGIMSGAGALGLGASKAGAAGGGVAGGLSSIGSMF